MFTGIVESAAEVAEVRRHAGGARLRLRGVGFAGELALGESVAVNGCCLTVVERGDGLVGFDLLEETLRVTNLGELSEGRLVNLERALRIGDRLSGHLVQGHVDGTARVLGFSPAGSDHRLEVELPREFRRAVIPRGSICVDGISLTAAEVGAEHLVCWIIPHTLEKTRLRTLREGERVNLEFDLVGKYVQRALRWSAAPTAEPEPPQRGELG